MTCMERKTGASVWCKYYLVCSPRSIDPDGISPPSLYRLVLTACGIEDYLGFRSVYITGLNRFTISHCSSHTPMPTLNPPLAASAPRLSTDCSLRFVGQGLSPRCLTCTELAHPVRILFNFFFTCQCGFIYVVYYILSPLRFLDLSLHLSDFF